MRSEAFGLFLKFHPSHISQSELEKNSLDIYKKCGSLLRLLNNIIHFEIQKEVVVILKIWPTKKGGSPLPLV